MLYQYSGFYLEKVFGCVPSSPTLISTPIAAVYVFSDLLIIEQN
jgi:hypothetical protein